MAARRRLIQTAIVAVFAGSLFAGSLFASAATADASASEVVSPTLQVDPTSAVPGDEVRITGSGWAVNGKVGIVFNDPRCLTTALATQSPVAGSINMTFKVPQPTGPVPHDYQVTACYGSKPVTSVYLTVVEAPAEQSLLLVKDRGVAGDTIHASGTNWVPSLGPVSLLLPGSTAPLTTGPVLADGTFTADFTIPKGLTSDNYVITACQDCASTDRHPTQTATLIVESKHLPVAKPGVAFVPATGQPLDVVGVSGVHWDPSRGKVRIFLRARDVQASSKALGSYPVLGNGTFTGSMTVPRVAARRYQLVACQQCTASRNRSVVTDFIVTSVPPLSPKLIPTPGHGRSGQSVQLSGSGWRTDGGAVLIFATQEDSSDAALALASVAPEVNGTFAVTLAVPDREAGHYAFVACQDCFVAGNRLATTAGFTIDATQLNMVLVVGFVAGLIVIAAVGGLLIRGRRPGASGRPDGSDQAERGPSPRPSFEPHRDDAVTVTRSPPGRPAVSLRLVPHQDRSAEPTHAEVCR